MVLCCSDSEVVDIGEGNGGGFRGKMKGGQHFASKFAKVSVRSWFCSCKSHHISWDLGHMGYGLWGIADVWVIACIPSW